MLSVAAKVCTSPLDSDEEHRPTNAGRSSSSFLTIFYHTLRIAYYGLSQIALLTSLAVAAFIGATVMTVVALISGLVSRIASYCVSSMKEVWS